MDRVAITEEVRALASLDLEGLRSEWKRRYGCPPKLRSVELLGLALAWRIQSDAFGGLDATTKRRARSGALPRGIAPTVLPGTVFTREFRGVVHRVVAVENGFTWNSQTYDSLSTVAFAMTGAKRSGPLFFGLKEAADGKG